ncbi:hypothetical protein [Sulfurovum sp.]|uniref:hypothetical protein n=1 Tax=Sulfurovum sp. TaxID=1969726 RepID=UPI00356967EF
MNSWDDFIWLITNPYFIALFLFALALEPLLKYMRRFYPESQQKAAKESEEFFQHLKENTEDKKLFQKANMKVILFIFGPTLIVFLIYIAYSLIVGLELKPVCVRDAFAKSATLFAITLGVYAIKTEQISRLLLQDDYDKVVELSKKQVGSDPITKFFEKHSPIFGYFSVVLGLIGLWRWS